MHLHIYTYKHMHKAHLVNHLPLSTLLKIAHLHTLIVLSKNSVPPILSHYICICIFTYIYTHTHTPHQSSAFWHAPLNWQFSYAYPDFQIFPRTSAILPHTPFPRRTAHQLQKFSKFSGIAILHSSI